jgi:hypothetical protein
VNRTQPLPLRWRQAVVVSTGPRPPAPSAAMRAASREVTTPMPVVGRAGTRERVRAGDAVFGGGEVR